MIGERDAGPTMNYAWRAKNGATRRFLGMRLHDEELALITRAAMRDGTAPAVWARAVLLLEAERLLKAKP